MPDEKAAGMIFFHGLVLVLMSLAFLMTSRAQAGELSLTQLDFRYPLASLNDSVGFIAAENGARLEDAGTLAPTFSAFGLNPDFRQHSRYWLYTQVMNNTTSSDWVVHISNFGYDRTAVLIRGENGQYTEVLQNANLNADINTIGRAVDIHLVPGKKYTLVVELTAYHKVWDPYIALMSKQQYLAWKASMDLVYKVAIGIIIGMILLALICWALMAEATFLWAGISSFLMLLYYLEHSSLAATFWNSAYEKNQIFWTLVSLVLLSLLAFAASFLQINRRSGYLYRAFMITTAVTLIVFAFSPLLSFAVRSFLYAGNYLLLWVVILGSGIAKIRSEGRYYIIYILGWLPMALSALEVILFVFLSRTSIHEVQSSYQMIWVLYIQILHMMIHAVALILRVKDMRRQKQAAEFASQAKSRFIAQSSHDLRQPLHSMRLFLESLQPYMTDDKARLIFDGLNKTRQHMSESFSAIMDLNKLEAGEYGTDEKPVLLSNLLSRLQPEFLTQARHKNIRLHIHSCSVTVYTDPVLLERILRNLVSNAIKYTDSGKVVVGCRRRGNTIAIQVMDTGSGITADEQKRIFDIYQRSHTAIKSADGVGIGLSIVRHMSQLLNHPLELTSTPGKGSVFTLSLPRVCNKTDHRQPVQIMDKQPVTVALLVTDTELRETLVSYLDQWECSVRVATVTEHSSSVTASEDLLIFDADSLSAYRSAGGGLNGVSAEKIIACVDSGHEADYPHDLMENFMERNTKRLSMPLLPSQLRALINHTVRVKNGDLNYHL